MAKLRKTQNDFSAGEIAAYSQARVDVAINYKGASKIENFIPMIQGGLTRRPSTLFVKEAASSQYKNRLIPFVYSTEEVFVINFTNNILQVLQDDTVVATIDSPYSDSELYNLQYTQSVNVLILACKGHAPYQLTRTADVWDLSPIDFKDGPYFEENLSETVVTIESFVDRAVLYSPASLFVAGMVGDVVEYRYEGNYFLAEGIELIDDQNLRVRPIENVLTDIEDTATFTITTPDKVQIVSSIAIFSKSVVNKYVRTADNQWLLIDEYIDTTTVKGAYISNMYSSSLKEETVTLGGRRITAQLSSSSTLFEENDVGRKIRLRLGNFQVWGNITEVSSNTDVTALFESPIPFSSNPDYEIESEGQTRSWRLGAWGEQYGYPYAVDFDKGRLVFAGNGFYPNRVWASVADDFYRFSPTELNSVVLDTNAVSYDLNSTQANEVQWVVGGRTLMVGTTGNIWSLTPSYFQNSLTPSDIGSNREDPYGCEPIKPLPIESSILYVQRYGFKIRELTYEYQSQAWSGQDLSAVADHLFRDVELGKIKDFCFQTEPFTIVWAVTEKGEIATLTYSKQYQKYAWARHKLGGNDVVVESVCSVPGKAQRQDDVYFCVSRTINGNTFKSVERLSKEFYPENSEDYRGSLYPDCLTFYGGPETDTITGLDYLEGETACVVVEGGTYTYQTVTNGQVTLPFSATNIGVGLFADARLDFLPVETALSEINTTHGYKKSIQQLHLKLWSSAGFDIESKGQVIATVVTRTAGEFGDELDSANDLFTGTKEEFISTGYEYDTSLSIVHNTPTPLTILSATVYFELSE